MKQFPSLMINRRSFGGGAAAAIASIGFRRHGAAGDPAASPAASPTDDARLIVHARGETLVPANPTRVIAVGDEFLLADLLDFGIKPIASSASYGDSFIGLPADEVEGITPFLFYQADIEQLLMMEPDLFVIPDYVFDYVENLYEQLSQFAPVVAVADQPDWRDEYRFVASIFGKETEADARISDLTGAVATAAADLSLDGQTVTVATVYPGEPSVTLWLTPGIAQTDVLVGLGLTLLPDAADFTVDDIGRASISVEQVNELTGDTLIMLQTTTSDQEQETFSVVTDDPLWQTIPAVQSGRVFVLERIGYPGEVRGRLALIDEYRSIFGAQ